MSLLDLIDDPARKLLNPSGGCHVCPRRRVDFVPPTLRQGQVLWLGEAPGADEVKEGEGFVGRSGQLLRRIAAESGVPEPWSFSNTIHCRPPKNATPKPKEINCCLSQFVLDEIRGYPIVVLAGSVPVKALFPGERTTGHFRGNLAYHPDYETQRFYSIYHPAYILRRPDLEPEFRQQLERLGRIVREGVRRHPVVHGSPDVLAAMDAILSSPLVSFDFETKGTQSWDPLFSIRCLAVSDGKQNVWVYKDDPWWVAALMKMGEYVQLHEKTVVGANVAFDLEILERELDITTQCSVQELAVIWHEAKQYRMASLKYLVSVELDGYHHLILAPHEETNLERLREYNIEDVVYGTQLFYKGMRLIRPRTQDLVTRVLGPTTLWLRRMTVAGIYIREEYRQQQIEEYTERRKAEILAWREEDPQFVPSEHESGNGLRMYLFDIHGLPAVDRTEKGEPTMDAAAVKQWLREYDAPFLQRLLNIREIDKILSTYLTAYDKFIGMDGRIHPSFRLAQADTGRSSSSNPNAQNIPRAKAIRNLFGVRSGVLGESDLSQIEFRIMVCLAKDENGIAGYLRGEDAHTMTARRITGKATPTKQDRTLAKPVNFGTLYGGSEYMLQQYAADEYGVIWDIEEARGFRRAFMETYPRIPEFHDASRAKLVMNRGWFESVVGHVFHYADWDNQDQGRRDHAFRSALNSEAQGPAAQICFYIGVLARRLLDQRGFQGVRMVNTVHDSILTEIPKEEWVSPVFTTINDAAQQAYKWVEPWFVVPLVMDHAYGEAWGSTKEWKP